MVTTIPALRQVALPPLAAPLSTGVPGTFGDIDKNKACTQQNEKIK